MFELFYSNNKIALGSCDMCYTVKMCDLQHVADSHSPTAMILKLRS